MTTRLYRIHPTPDSPHIVTVACCGDSEHALILARRNPWVAQQMTDEACAVETEELLEEGA